MKKLVYILNQYSEQESSHFYHVVNLLKEMARNNVKITLVIEKSSSVPLFDIKNIDVIQQKKRGIFRGLELMLILARLRSQGYKKAFVRISTTAALPSILFYRMFGGAVYFWQSGTTHAHERRKKFNLSRFLKQDLPFYLVKKTTHFFVTGPEFMVDYYHKEIGVKKNKLICLYNDIDTNRFVSLSQEEKGIIKDRLGLERDKKIILFVKRMSSIKGILFYSPYIISEISDTIIANNYQCIYLGDGEEKDKLEKIVDDENLSDLIHILGGKPNKDIQDYYQIADIFINPTLEEGFPRVLIEAMSSGLPVVTTDAGGTTDIVGNLQKKFMVDTKDRKGFSNLLRDLILDEELQYKLSQENIAQAQLFSTTNVAKMYIKEIFPNEK